MHAGSAGARSAVAAQVPEAERILAGPVPLDPLRRSVLYRDGDVYRTGHTGAFGAGGVTIADSIPLNDDHPAARAAAGTREGRLFLVWSRYPFFDLYGTRVWIADARYVGPRTEWAAVPIDLEPAPAEPAAQRP
jgi:hypothetical protein